MCSGQENPGQKGEASMRLSPLLIIHMATSLQGKLSKEEDVRMLHQPTVQLIVDYRYIDY
jgi:hypothetical protein